VQEDPTLPATVDWVQKYHRPHYLKRYHPWSGFKRQKFLNPAAKSVILTFIVFFLISFGPISGYYVTLRISLNLQDG
jgi:hypothetical protein